DILVGDDQAKVRRGGPGRDILIGRGGPDALFGGAADDILTGGSTDPDLNAAPPEAILGEWANGGVEPPATPAQQYHARIAHLLGNLPDGNNGTAFLNLSTGAAARFPAPRARRAWVSEVAGRSSQVAPSILITHWSGRPFVRRGGP